MSEGGLLAWKVQKVRSAPTLKYNNLQKELRAPKGQRWQYDSVTREWSLEDLRGLEEQRHPNDLVVLDGEIVRESPSSEGSYGPLVLEHLVQPTDTFEGICLRYGVGPTEIRRANNFTGNNLFLAPNPLKIPRPSAVSTSAEAEWMDVGAVDKVPKALTTDQVVAILMKGCPRMTKSEARAYLELNDWDVADAKANAEEDGF